MMSSETEKAPNLAGSAVISSSDENNSSLDVEKNINEPGGEDQDDEEDELNYLSGIKLWLVIISLCCSVLLMGLVYRPDDIMRINADKR